MYISSAALFWLKWRAIPIARCLLGTSRFLVVARDVKTTREAFHIIGPLLGPGPPHAYLLAGVPLAYLFYSYLTGLLIIKALEG